MKDEVARRLAFFGYECHSAADDIKIDVCVNIAEQAIKSICNIEKIPEALRHVQIDMACGHFFKMEQPSLKPAGDGIIKSIQEGDTAIAFDTSKKDLSLNDFADILINSHKDALAAHRRIKW